MKPTSAIAVLTLALMLATGDALAQRFPGRGGGGGEGSREMPRRGEREARQAPSPGMPEPFGALERELPSLKVDLLLRREQLDAWVPFERAVRDLTEIDRVRRRNLMALRDGGAGTPSAVGLVGMLADEDRQKADASAEVKRRLDSLYAALDEPQQRMLDRRVVLSQTEPIGAERR